MLQKHLATAVFGLAAILAPAFVMGQPMTNAQVDECSKEILLSYFPEPFVVPTLKKFNVPQEKIDPIVQALAEKNKDVLRLVEERASKMDPNPFKGFDPSQRAAAVKIFRETLTQVFGDVLKANGVTDDNQIAQMLEDIQRQKAANFAKCREKELQEIQPGAQVQPGIQTQPGYQIQPEGGVRVEQGVRGYSETHSYQKEYQRNRPTDESYNPNMPRETSPSRENYDSTMQRQTSPASESYSPSMQRQTSPSGKSYLSDATTPRPQKPYGTTPAGQNATDDDDRDDDSDDDSDKDQQA